MKRFLLLTTRLILFFVVVFVVMIGIARTQPSPPLLSDEIKTCDGQICARKVVLDQTTLADAETILDSDPDLTVERNLGEISASAQNGTLIFAVSGDALTDDAKIGNLEIDFWNGENTVYPMLGDFIVRYGPPCKVTIHQAVHTLTVFYPNMYLLFVQNDDNIIADLRSLSPFLRVGSTFSYSDPDFCTINDPDTEKPWKGFVGSINYGETP